MMRTFTPLRWSLTLLLALSAGCGGGSGASEDGVNSANGGPTPLVAPGTWVVLGSSTAAGIGAPPNQGWAARLAAQMRPANVNLVNLARGGLQSSQALPAGEPAPGGQPPPDPAVNVDAALAHTPALLILAFPSNDAAAGVPAAESVANLRKVVAHAASRPGRSAATLVLGTQPRAGLDATQRTALVETDARAASEFGPCFVPLREALSDPDGEPAAAYAAGDGIHLNAAGHALILARVNAALTSARCVRLAP